MYFIVLVSSTIFNGTCPEDQQEHFNLIGFYFKVVLLMPGQLTQNHIFRNIFGHFPDCYTMSVMIQNESFTDVMINFKRDAVKYPFLKRNACSEIYTTDDQIIAEIQGSQVTFWSISANIFKARLPFRCTKKLSWKSKINAITYNISTETDIIEELYIVLWACEELPGGQYDLGIVTGFNSIFTENVTAMIYERNRILQTSLKVLRSLPFAANFTFEDFQTAKFHSGVLCELCEKFECK